MKYHYASYHKIKLTAFIALIFCSTVSVADVEITIADQTINYAVKPRLVDVLAPIAEKKNWYWAGAAIFKFEAKEVNLIRNQAIEQLVLLGQRHESHKSDYQNFIFQLESWQLATRMVSDIDFELSRIRPDKNPAFAEGRYYISLSQRPDYVYFNGAISKPVRLDFLENACVDDYLQQLSPLGIASKDLVYIVQPNGLIKSVGIAYWNKQCAMVMPGSQIYVPLQESFISSDAAKLNKSIIKLMSNRILNQ